MTDTLRALLHAPPSSEAWAALCAHLQALYASDPASIAPVLPACEAAVAGWPARSPDDAWLERLGAGEVVPMMRLVNTIQDAILDDAALVALAGSPACAGLRVLHVQECEISDASMEALAASPYFTGFTELELFWCDVTDDGFNALIESGKLSELTALYLKEVDISGWSVVALLQRPDAPKLTALAMGVIEDGPAFDDDEIVALAACPALSELESLDLTYNELYDEAALALARSPHLRKLRNLELGKNHIGRTGALALATSENLAGLEWLALHDNVGYEADGIEEVPEAFYEELAERYPIITA